MREWLIVAMFAVAAPAHADWAAVPLAVLVDEADVMVVGRVAKVQDGGFDNAPAPRSRLRASSAVVLVAVIGLMTRRLAKTIKG